MELKSGQNVALQQMSPAVTVIATAPSAEIELDVSAFSLTPEGKVRGDADMSFYGQPRSSDGSVMLDPVSRRFDLDLAKVPSAIDKIAICLTIDQGLTRRQSFSQLSDVQVRVGDGTVQHVFRPDTSNMTETALILLEVYRRSGQWKVRALGQGFNGGLGPMASHFGVNVEDDPDAAPPGNPAKPQKEEVTPPPSSVNLNKITLEKRQSVNLSKNDARFGKITVNLTWNSAVSGGFLSKLRGGAVDLDLGCMYEHRDGHKGVIQALGASFGSYNQPPYCHLAGDDRSGTTGQGEFLYINGDQWSNFKRALIFAYIYEGIPSWDKANAGIRVTIPNQPELIANIDSHERRGMCAIALLENGGNDIKVTKLIDYFDNHRELDRAYGFGFNWKRGTK